MARNITKGVDAERTLDDPVIRGAIDSIERDYVEALAMITLDGSVETNALIVEKVRDMQANRRLIHKLREQIALGKIEARSQQDAENRPKRVKDPRWGGA